MNRCFFHPVCQGQQDLFKHECETIVFLDFETSGLDVMKQDIIEIGAVKIDKYGKEHYFETLIKPNNAISGKIK